MLYNCLNSILLINAERERERTNINLIFNGRNPQVRFREIFHDDFCFNFSFFWNVLSMNLACVIKFNINKIFRERLNDRKI